MICCERSDRKLSKELRVDRPVRSGASGIPSMFLELVVASVDLLKQLSERRCSLEDRELVETLADLSAMSCAAVSLCIIGVSGLDWVLIDACCSLDTRMAFLSSNDSQIMFRISEGVPS